MNNIKIFGTGLIIFGILILMFPVILAALVSGFLIFSGISLLIASFGSYGIKRHLPDNEGVYVFERTRRWSI